MKISPIFVLAITPAFIGTLLLNVGCKYGEAEIDAADGQGVIDEEVQAKEAKEADDAGQVDEEQVAGEESDETESEEDSLEELAGEETDQGQTAEAEVPEEEMEISDEITLKIEEANNLFLEGLYAEASKEYRDVQIAIDKTDLSDETKQELFDSIDENFNTSQVIIDTARIHHSNAMNLIYEKRYEEAEAELKTALVIYPKYQTVIEVLKSIEDLKSMQ